MKIAKWRISFSIQARWPKLYHKEVGSESLERILHQPNTRSLISRLSIVEMESVFAIKIRSGQLDIPNMEIARRRLRADLAQRRIFVGPPVEEKHFYRAREDSYPNTVSLKASAHWMRCSYQ